MLFNQQQCFIYSTASFLSKLRAKKVEKLHNSSFYRNFRKLNIGFRNWERLFPVLSIIINKKKSRPTDTRFFWHVTVNTHIFFFGLISLICMHFFPHWIHLKFSCRKCCSFFHIRDDRGPKGTNASKGTFFYFFILIG